jgi:hypothetical protein
VTKLNGMEPSASEATSRLAIPELPDVLWNTRIEEWRLLGCYAM